MCHGWIKSFHLFESEINLRNEKKLIWIQWKPFRTSSDFDKYIFFIFYKYFFYWILKRLSFGCVNNIKPTTTQKCEKVNFISWNLDKCWRFFQKSIHCCNAFKFNILKGSQNFLNYLRTTTKEIMISITTFYYEINSTVCLYFILTMCSNQK
jgi:hypothetical protein